MTSVYLTAPQTTRVRRRCFRIEIDTPNIGDRSIVFHQEDVTEDTDGNQLSSKQAPSLAMEANTIIMDTLSITDPVTGLTTLISGAAIAMWLEMEYTNKVIASLTPPIVYDLPPDPTPPVEPPV